MRRPPWGMLAFSCSRIPFTLLAAAFVRLIIPNLPSSCLVSQKRRDLRPPPPCTTAHERRTLVRVGLLSELDQPDLDLAGLGGGGPPLDQDGALITPAQQARGALLLGGQEADAALHAQEAPGGYRDHVGQQLLERALTYAEGLDQPVEDLDEIVLRVV